MARKKVKLAWIQNDAARRATFKKRRKGLLKKISELSTLCGIEACAIVYNPQESAPEVFPADNKEVIRVLNRFRSVPDMEKSKKMLNQEGFLRHRIAKLGDQLKKTERDNRESEINSLMYQCIDGRPVNDLGIETVTSLGWSLEMMIKRVHEAIESRLTANATVGSNARLAMALGSPSSSSLSSSSSSQKIMMVPAAIPPLQAVEGLPPGPEMDSAAATDVFKRPEDMFMCAQQFFWPAEDPASMHQYMGDSSTHLPPTSSFADQNMNNQWSLENFFQV